MHFRKMRGDRCYLSPLDIDDAEKFTRWLNDLDITQYLTLSSANISLLSEKEFLPTLVKEHNYAIVDSASDVMIGSCGLNDVDYLNRTAELGLFIGDKKFLGQGYGREAIRLLLNYAFNILNLQNIILKVYSFNERAIKCYQAVGFREIGRRRKAVIRNRQSYDIIYMDILCDEFCSQNPQEQQTFQRA